MLFQVDPSTCNVSHLNFRTYRLLLMIFFIKQNIINSYFITYRGIENDVRKNQDYQKLFTNVLETERPPLLNAPPASPTHAEDQGPYF